MYITAEELGYTTKEIHDIVEGLYQEEISRGGKCPDCGVSKGEAHKQGCDISQCVVCGEQSCSEHNSIGVWDGMWPGTDICYQHKLLCCVGHEGVNKGDIKWMFDYNRAAVIKYSSMERNKFS